MVVRSAQKNMDEVQKIRAAMEGNKPVITVAQQELITKYADILGEDGKAMMEAIEEEARKPDKMPADIFKLIESCLSSLSQKAKRQGLSDEVIKQREPVRLQQVEAMREHATMLHANRLNGDKLGEESVRKAMKKLVDEYMAAVEQDKEDGLDPDTARTWKEQAQEIVAQAKLDQPVASCGVSKSGPVAHPRVKDRLAPLSSAIEQATYTMQAVTRELTDPNETVLRGFG
jgi:ribosome-binding ATPase YchF (GTP1/OBG family)